MINGLPRRETWTHGPDSDGLPCPLSTIRIFRRLAALQTPITEELAITFFGLEPFLVRWEIGIWMAIVWMLSVLVASTAAAAALGIRCRFWNGRRSPRSKIDPRST